MDKRQLLDAGIRFLEEKCNDIGGELNELQDIANQETKSSAGDKYETGRAMLQIEKDKLTTRLVQVEQQLKTLRQLDPATNDVGSIRHGSLVQTDRGWLYLSTGLGLIEDVFYLSPGSPLGQMLVGKKEGDTLSFRKNNYHLLKVL